MKRFFALLIASLLLGSATRAAETVTVAVAANVKPAFGELARAFEADTGIAAKGVFGSSGKMTAQVREGAPYDVFLSADTEYPDALKKDGYAANEPRVYAYGTLVLWTMADVDLGKGLALLTEDAIRKIALPNPRLAPYGREAVRALAHEQIYSAVEAKLVYGESISQATQFVQTQAADVGFTAKSIVLSPELADQGKWVEVPAGSYRPIAQSAVVLKHGAGKHPEASTRFFDFLYSEKARAVFTRYGYVLP
jgi:molybdate transport system substrate-binding protein